jgi:hypothetical protein
MSAPVFEGTTPLVSDRYLITLTAGEDLAIGELAEISADWTAKKATTNPSGKIIGLVLTSALSGKKVTIVCRGIARAIAYGTVTYGDQVVSAPGGKVQSLAAATSDDGNTSAGTALAINNARSVIGKCVAGAVSGGTAYVALF